ncbi:hypothetical protein WDZ92_34140 [Nostoc sp. NIES-2111]
MASMPGVRVSTFAVHRSARQRRLEHSAKTLAVALIGAGCLLLGLSVLLG